uniref:Uncharacterized protein n=1 Tax=Anguilla anguilla TaxID=7936 RepID=A0A0E9P6F9_ANGAN
MKIEGWYYKYFVPFFFKH